MKEEKRKDRAVSEISIVPALIEHIDDILAIEKASFKKPWSREAFLSEITNTGLSAYFVALENGKTVGYSGISIMVDEAHIMNIAVHPEYRGRGIGQMLLDRLIRYAWDNHITAVTLEVSVLNTVAIRFYKKNGFSINGLRKGYYGDEDAYIMWLFRNDNETRVSGGTDYGVE